MTTMLTVTAVSVTLNSELMTKKTRTMLTVTAVSVTLNSVTDEEDDDDVDGYSSVGDAEFRVKYKVSVTITRKRDTKENYGTNLSLLVKQRNSSNSSVFVEHKDDPIGHQANGKNNLTTLVSLPLLQIGHSPQWTLAKCVPTIHGVQIGMS